MLLYLFSMNRLRKIFILFVIVLLTIPRQAHGRETYRYELDFIFIPAVDIVMEITDTIYLENQSLALLQLHTKTRPVFNHFFEADNVYKTIYDPQTFIAYSSEKSIEQPNISQEIRTIYSEKTDVFYWKIASSEGQKFIWLEQAEQRRIVKAEFHSGLARLVAKLDSGRNEIFP